MLSPKKEVCVGSVGRIVITYSQGGNRFGGDLKLVEVVGLIRDLKYELKKKQKLACPLDFYRIKKLKD